MYLVNPLIVNGSINVIQSGTTITTASGALNNTSTGNITVGSTTGWPQSGVLRTIDTGSEFMAFTVVDGTTLNITARGQYSTTNAAHTGVVTLAYASQINSTSTSASPLLSSWSDGAFFTGTTTLTGNLVSDTSTLVVDSTNHRVGIGTTSPSVVLDIVGTSIRQSNTTTDATNKAFRFQTRNFTNSQNDFLLVFGQSKTSANTLILGGGQAGSVAASTVSIFTGAGNNTDTGTARMTVDASGNVLISSLTASKLVFTDSLKNLTSTGIGTSGQFIKGDGSLDSSTYLTSTDISNLVTGPSSATDNAIARFDSTTGKLIQNSGIFINDSGGLVIAPYFTTGAQTIRHAYPFYSTGTASQSGTTITGSGTTWTTGVIDKTFTFANGTRRTITARPTSTSITVLESGSVSSQAYSIDYPVFETFTNGTAAFGYNSVTPGGGSKVLFYGGGSGCNIDAHASTNPNETDVATFEAQPSDYGSSFQSSYIQYWGPNGTGTTAGFSNVNLGSLILNGNTNVIGTVMTSPVIFITKNLECFRFDSTGQAKFASPIRTSGVSNYFTITAPADTGLTASTEAKGIEFVGATRQHATGALTTQREIVIGAPTYSFVGASTLTTAVTLDIADPIAGTNATITNSYGLRAVNASFTTVTLPTNGQILLTVPTTDGHATGPTTNAFNSGYSSSAVGDLVYLDSSSTWQLCDANTTLLYNGFLGIALEVKASGNALLVALPGSFIYATAFPTFTIGGPIFMSETAGAVTQTAPTTTDAATRMIGWGIHADKMYFNPSQDYITHT